MRNDVSGSQAESARGSAQPLSITVSFEERSRLISLSGELVRATMLEFIQASTSDTEASLIIDLGIE